MNTVWCPSLISWYHFYSILKQFCLSAIYLLILSTQVIAEYRLGTAFSQRLSRTFLLWTFSIVCFQGEEVGSTRRDEHQGNFFLCSFTCVSGNISIKEDSSLSFYQIQRSYGTSVTNSLSIIYVSNPGPGDRSYGWKQKLVAFWKEGADALGKDVSELCFSV